LAYITSKPFIYFFVSFIAMPGAPGLTFGDFSSDQDAAATAESLLSLGGMPFAGGETTVEPFPGFIKFWKVLDSENKRRHIDRPFMTAGQLVEFLESMDVCSVTCLKLLSVPEPEGFMGAVLAASPPCGCFGAWPPMDRKLFASLVKIHTLNIGTTVPPGGVVTVGAGGTSADSRTSGTSGEVSLRTTAEVGSKSTCVFYDLDGVIRTSMSSKSIAAESYKLLLALWRLVDEDRISHYVQGPFMIYDSPKMLVLWRNNAMNASLGAPLPSCWANARMYSQVKCMNTFTDPIKLDRFIQMNFNGQDLNSGCITDFHPSGGLPWTVTDASTSTAGAKIFLKECLEGLVTALVFVFSDKFEAARALLTSGLGPSSYNAQAHPDAVVLFCYHAALVTFATTITQDRGTVEKPLSGPVNTGKLLMKCFAHLTSEQWVSPATKDFTVFKNEVFPVVKWPCATPTQVSPGSKRKPDAEKDAEERRKYEERRVRREINAFKDASALAASSASLSSTPLPPSLGLSLNSLSLVNGNSAAVGATGAPVIKGKGDRLCVSVLCQFAGVKYLNNIVQCRNGSGCKYSHPDSVDEVLKGDAARAIGSLKRTSTDPETINYLTAAENFYAERDT